MKTYLPIIGIGLVAAKLLGFFSFAWLFALIPFMVMFVGAVVFYLVYLHSGYKFTSFLPAIKAFVAKCKAEAALAKGDFETAMTEFAKIDAFAKKF